MPGKYTLPIHAVVAFHARWFMSPPFCLGLSSNLLLYQIRHRVGINYILFILQLPSVYGMSCQQDRHAQMLVAPESMRL